jgi:hypothetical protein
MLNSHGPTRAGRGGDGERIGSNVGTGAAPGQRVIGGPSVFSSLTRALALASDPAMVQAHFRA